jgi:hypothetical protein
MSSLYGGYAIADKGQPPKDEAAFRAYLETKVDELQKAGLTVDDMFVSPRGQPIQWVYGTKPVSGRAGMKYIGYEQAPVANKRLVIAANGMYDLMEEAEFRRSFPGAP